MTDLEKRTQNILRKSRIIDGEEYSDDEILEVFIEGVKAGVVDRLTVPIVESRLNKGMEMTPIEGFSNRDLEEDFRRCLGS